MKGIHISCASQAATAIRQIMDEGSSSSSAATIHLGGGGGGRAIDRHNPIIRDATRSGKPPLPRLPPCSSQPPPTNPKPYHRHHKTSTQKTTTSSKPNNDHHHRRVKKSSSSSTTSKASDDQKRKGVCDELSDGTVIKKSWSCTKPGDFISPPASSRYLLSDKAFLDVLSDFDPVLTLVPVEPSKSQALKIDDHQSSASLPPSSSRSPDQVVVLRVSLHCKGCEKKMRKHISRMEGVTSFNIDFAAKKVTVVGDVTPLSVLASVSKVKNAQLLTPTISSSLPTVPSSCPEINKYNGVGV